MITVTHIATKQHMARWTRKHAGAPGITWSTVAGDGGTMLITGHPHDRSAVPAGAAREETAW